MIRWISIYHRFVRDRGHLELASFYSRRERERESISELIENLKLFDELISKKKKEGMSIIRIIRIKQSRSVKGTKRIITVTRAIDSQFHGWRGKVNSENRREPRSSLSFIRSNERR